MPPPLPSAGRPVQAGGWPRTQHRRPVGPNPLQGRFWCAVFVFLIKAQARSCHARAERAVPARPRRMAPLPKSAADPPRLDSPAAGSGFRVQLDDLQIYPTRVPPQGAAAPEPCEGAGCLASVQAPAGGNEDQVVAAFLPGSSPIIPLFGEADVVVSLQRRLPALCSCWKPPGRHRVAALLAGAAASRRLGPPARPCECRASPPWTARSLATPTWLASVATPPRPMSARFVAPSFPRRRPAT